MLIKKGTRILVRHVESGRIILYTVAEDCEYRRPNETVYRLFNNTSNNIMANSCKKDPNEYESFVKNIGCEIIEIL
jgi:hypothetical protein